MSYFETRRNKKVKNSSDAIAEEEAVSDITSESQQLSQLESPESQGESDAQTVESSPAGRKLETNPPKNLILDIKQQRRKKYRRYYFCKLQKETSKVFEFLSS